MYGVFQPIAAGLSFALRRPPRAHRCGLMAVTVRALASGSSGNAVLVQADKTALLIDAGLPGRTLARLLREYGVRPGHLAGILITHEHSDHISGAATLSRQYRAPVIAT